MRIRKTFTPLEKVHPVRENSSNGVKERNSLTGFTLIGVLITVVILAILVTIGSPLYLKAVENARAKVCATNLRVLKAAVESYGVEEGVLPASLSMLRPKDMKKAWAKVFQKENPWLIKLAYFLVDFDKRGLAYATTTSLSRFAALDAKTLTCPDDKNGLPSYGINSRLAGKKWHDYLSLAKNTWVIGDCDSDCCGESDLRARHFHYTLKGKKHFYQVVRKNNKLIRKDEDSGDND